MNKISLSAPQFCLKTTFNIFINLWQSVLKVCKHFVHFNFLSIQNPKKQIFSTNGKTLSCKTRIGLSLHSFFFLQKWMCLDFETENLHPLRVPHFSNLTKMFCSYCMNWIYSLLIRMVKSSGNNVQVAGFSTYLTISLIVIKKRETLKTEPWGMPFFNSNMLNNCSPILTWKILLSKKLYTWYYINYIPD